MKEITFTVEQDEESSWLCAFWDAPDGHGGISTQGQNLAHLEAMIVDAVTLWFDQEPCPEKIRLQFPAAFSLPFSQMQKSAELAEQEASATLAP